MIIISVNNTGATIHFYDRKSAIKWREEKTKNSATPLAEQRLSAAC